MVDRLLRLFLRLVPHRFSVQLVSWMVTNSLITRENTMGLLCPSLNCYACPAAAFSCPVGTLQHFVIGNRAPLYPLGFIGLVGVVIGRTSCGWFCPFGWLQEIIYRLKVPKLRLPNRFTWIRYIVLIGLVFVLPALAKEPWFCKICPAGTLEAGIPMLLLNSDLQSLAGWMFVLKVGILGTLLAWMSTTKRPFCRWICPLGAMWALFNPVSVLQIKVDQNACTACGQCREVCPVDILIHENPASGACIRCMACVKACPTEAIKTVLR